MFDKRSLVLTVEVLCGFGSDLITWSWHSFTFYKKNSCFARFLTSCYKNLNHLMAAALNLKSTNDSGKKSCSKLSLLGINDDLIVFLPHSRSVEKSEWICAVVFVWRVCTIVRSFEQFSCILTGWTLVCIHSERTCYFGSEWKIESVSRRQKKIKHYGALSFMVNVWCMCVPCRI